MSRIEEPNEKKSHLLVKYGLIAERFKKSFPVKNITNGWEYLMNLALTDEKGSTEQLKAVDSLNAIFKQASACLDEAKQQQQTPNQQAELALAILKDMDTDNLEKIMRSLKKQPNVNPYYSENQNSFFEYSSN